MCLCAWCSLVNSQADVTHLRSLDTSFAYLQFLRNMIPTLKLTLILHFQEGTQSCFSYLKSSDSSAFWR